MTARYAVSSSGSSTIMDMRGQVWITGFLDNHGVRRELEAARALVMPSFAEGLPVVIMEAMALGRPVISTYIAGIPELVEPGRHGWLVPAGAVEPLAAAMAAALTADTVDLRAMGRAGAARVAERHDVDNEAKKLAELIADPDCDHQRGKPRCHSCPGHGHAQEPRGASVERWKNMSDLGVVTIGRNEGERLRAA